MADVAPSSHLRQKKVRTYGKTYRRKAFEVADFEDDEGRNERQLQPLQPARTITQSYPVEKSEAKTQDNRSTKTSTTKRDAFDVPSSDDETTNAPKRVSPVKPPTLKRHLVSEEKEHDLLAPWERKKAKLGWAEDPSLEESDHTVASSPSPARIRSRTASPRRILEQRASGCNHVTKVLVPMEPDQSMATTAAARLAARRQMLTKSAQSSADELQRPELHSPPRSSNKRFQMKSKMRIPNRSKTTDNVSGEEDIDMLVVEDSTRPTGKSASSKEIPADSPDIYDVPENDEEDRTEPTLTSRSPPASVHKLERGKLVSQSRRQKIEKTSSAPTRLAEMVPSDVESPEPPSRSPSIVPPETSPEFSLLDENQYDAPSTPPGREFTPDAAVRAGTMTPRQAEIWNKLDILSSETAAASPSALALQDLTIGAKRRTLPSQPKGLARSNPDFAQRRRTRLVDRLKQSAPPSSEDEASSSESEIIDDQDEDTIMLDEKELGSCNRVVAPAKPESIEHESRVSNSHTQSQPSDVKIETGPRITYGKMRSYLAEDNVEDGLLMDLPSLTPQRAPAAARRTIKTGATSQPSAFDIEDSDDEGGATKLRNIHELRAAGRNRRVMQDLEALLADIADHDISARSRRRSALIEIGTKLLENSYVERFLGQGAERQLAAESTSQNDEVTAFLLAGCTVLVLSTDPSEQTIMEYYRAGIIESLVDMLPYNVECSKYVRDRKNNISKATQATLVEFAGQAKALDRVWNQGHPSFLSTRLLALKALDLLVGRLRRSGERGELIHYQQIQLVLPRSDNPIESTTAISILEALSTTAASLQWPVDVLSQLGRMLPAHVPDDKVSRHTCFLTLRLLMNLTNDSLENCETLTAEYSIASLLCLIIDGFLALATVLPTDTENWAITLDQVVLATGIMINLAEHSSNARKLTSADKHGASIASLVAIFKEGQKRMLEAESVEESTSNVAYGYLAVLLANLCQSKDARIAIAAHLPGHSLGPLVEAVEEFVVHHQRVDTMSFEGAEGQEVWGAFTEKLKAVLEKLKAVAA